MQRGGSLLWPLGGEAAAAAVEGDPVLEAVTRPPPPAWGAAAALPLADCSAADLL
ncbi:hypothetical protein MNEG_6715, partial [Monoraphidium neglectum]